MDAFETGKRIKSLRKEHGWTQKELANRLCVSDKAVSKWERGLNYPDINLLDPLANVLETTVMQLLGIENVTESEKVEAVTALAAEETERVRKETRERALTGLFMTILIWISLFYLGHLLIEREVYDLPLSICNATFCLINFLLGNHFWIWWKYRK